ncbi:unnamed protein product [Closterium sp. Naga37s-1]|nr:unnamed protein product [Closterium sp. Naga37s-1]
MPRGFETPKKKWSFEAPQKVLFTLIKELSDAHPEIKSPEQSAALLGGIKVELPSERERELMQQIAEMRCKVATLVDNVITYRKRNAQLMQQIAEMRCKVATLVDNVITYRNRNAQVHDSKVPTLVDNVITYRNRNAQLGKQVVAFQQRKEERTLLSFLTPALPPPPLSRVSPAFPSPAPPLPPSPFGEAGRSISAEEGGEREAGGGAEAGEVTSRGGAEAGEVTSVRGRSEGDMRGRSEGVENVGFVVGTPKTRNENN